MAQGRLDEIGSRLGQGRPSQLTHSLTSRVVPMIEIHATAALPWRVVVPSQHLFQLGAARILAPAHRTESRHATRQDAEQAMLSATVSEEREQYLGRSRRKPTKRFIQKDLIRVPGSQWHRSVAMLYNSIA